MGHPPVAGNGATRIRAETFTRPAKTQYWERPPPAERPTRTGLGKFELKEAIYFNAVTTSGANPAFVSLLKLLGRVDWP